MGAAGGAGIAVVVAAFPRLAWECHRAYAAAASGGRMGAASSGGSVKMSGSGAGGGAVAATAAAAVAATSAAALGAHATAVAGAARWLADASARSTVVTVIGPPVRDREASPAVITPLAALVPFLPSSANAWGSPGPSHQGYSHNNSSDPASAAVTPKP